MKRLFLTSQFSIVAQDIGKKINKKGLKLVFILTAAEVEGGDLKWLNDDRKALINAGFELTDYTFTNKNKVEVREFLKDFDGIYISGGNTFWLLEKIQQSNCANVIRDFVNNGKLYISTSAGSIVAGPDILPIKDLDNIKKAPNIKGYKGLCLVDFVIFPHWGNDIFKDRYLKYRMEHSYNRTNNIILLTDNSYIEVKDDWYRIIEVKNA